MVNKTTGVGTAVYSCKTRAARAGMRLSIAVEHPGDLLLTVMERFPPNITFQGLEKWKNLWFHVLSLEYLSVAVFPLGS